MFQFRKLVQSVFLLIYLINKTKKIIKSSLDVQDYPKNRHPGWSRGSIAYHAGEHATTFTEHWQYLLLLAVGLDTVLITTIHTIPKYLLS